MENIVQKNLFAQEKKRNHLFRRKKKKNSSSLKTQPYPAYGLFKCIFIKIYTANDGLKNHYINNTILIVRGLE